MRKENQKIRGAKRVTGKARRGHQARSGPFNGYRVEGNHFEPIRIFAQSPEQAELVARRILGVGQPYGGELVISEECRL